MKRMSQFSRLIFVLLSFAVLLLAGCGGGSDSTPTGTFTTNQVSGKTFAYSSAGSTGTLAFNADGTWSTTIGASTFSGTWSVSNGKLVCVTTVGGNHTVTYTLLTTTSNSMTTSYVEVNPADPNNPVTGTAVFTATFTTAQVSGKTFAYSSSTGSTGTLVFNADGTWSTTIGTSTFSGIWSVSNGKLVCVTTSGGNHTLTYTALVSDDTTAIHASVVEVNPSDPANPATYTATLTALYTIAGKVSQSDTGLAGVTVALEGDQTLTATTDADGNYRFTVPAGEYRVTPSKVNTTFAPLDNNFAVRSANVGAVDFASVAPMAGPSVNKWIQTGSLIYRRYHHTSTLLQDGRVLVVGGLDDKGNVRASAELYDPATGKWAQTGSLNYERYDHKATLLPNGKVLVAGGSAAFSTRASAELYDPATGKWTQTGSMTDDRKYHTATLLQNGKVLIAGGKDNIYTHPTAELYDPATGKWTQTGSMNYKRSDHTATLLPDGRVLIAGGSAPVDVDGGERASTELYDPATGKWTLTGYLNFKRIDHAATLLPNGKVLVAGGHYADVGGKWGDTVTELYDPATGKWTLTGSLNSGHSNGQMISLQDGRAFFAGGEEGVVLTIAEIYDLTTGKWTLTDSMNYRRQYQTLTLLQDGRVLAAGGNGGAVDAYWNSILTSTEWFYPGP